jgi:hypothetical protein
MGQLSPLGTFSSKEVEALANRQPIVQLPLLLLLLLDS